jgi:hypothetical protein
MFGVKAGPGRQSRVYLVWICVLVTVYAGLDLYGFFPREGSKAFPANHNLAVAYAKMGNYEDAYKQEL